MNYYKSSITDNIFTETQINIVNDIYGEDKVKSSLEFGVFKKIENPSVVDFLNCRNFAGAVARYRDIHNVNLKEATNSVRSMRSFMEKLRNGNDD